MCTVEFVVSKILPWTHDPSRKQMTKHLRIISRYPNFNNWRVFAKIFPRRFAARRLVVVFHERKRTARNRDRLTRVDAGKAYPRRTSLFFPTCARHTNHRYPLCAPRSVLPIPQRPLPPTKSRSLVSPPPPFHSSLNLLIIAATTRVVTYGCFYERHHSPACARDGDVPSPLVLPRA